MAKTRIVVVGGKTKADFLIGILLKKNYQISVINDDEVYSMHLARKYDIPVIYGDPRKAYVYDDAEVQDFDAVLAVMPNDADNFAACLIAKKIFNIKKSICIVSNPRNVEAFKTLGVNKAISATYDIANIIEEESFNELFKSPKKCSKISQVEIDVKSSFICCNLRIGDMDLPNGTTLGALIRKNKIVQYDNNTVILKDDKLVFLSTVFSSKVLFIHLKELIC